MAQRKPQSDSTPQPIPVVAIGASAGGLEAISTLLTRLSATTGFAYVYIQHLPPDRDSTLAQVLGRYTSMPVFEAQPMQRIEPNQVYIIPPDNDLEIIDGVLTLLPRQESMSLENEVKHLPIDRFFISLADRQKAGSIGILLSGMDNDGTQGLKAIKSAGGITIAQDQTALYQGMPRSAIAEGVVDLILSPDQIALELERLSLRPDIFQQTALAEEQEDHQPSDEDLKPILAFLRKTVGVDFSQYKVTTIRRRIIRRMLLYKLETLRDYAQYIRQHPQEAGLLYSDLLINVTAFFRDTEVMEYLKKVLLPRLLHENHPGEPLRIWVPACSTGQEAYSLAMLLLEVLGDQASQRIIQIFATDLSETAIAKARLGTYSRSEVLDISPRRLSRFFTKQDDVYRINKVIRDLCVFAPHNIFKDPPFSRVDLVSCRNLLIYLNSSLQRQALTIFHYGLNPRGYLLLGKSETVGTSTSLFTPVEKAYKVFARKNDVARRASFELQPRSIEVNPVTPAPRRLPVNRPASTPGHDLEQRVDAMLLSQYIPASVVVNQDLDILSFRGSTALYLEHSQGRASLNLLKMARPSLSFELRNAVHKVLKSGQPVRKTGLEMKVGGTTHYVAIEATPLESDAEDRLFLIIFQETSPPIIPETGPVKARNRRIKELEEELATVRRDMHSLIEEQEAGNEELQSANEEIVSSNEELQSINEELETSKEEIESTNEELLTINQELQVRNEQLSEAYEFAEAIFATLREATLVLDADLRVRSANSTFYEMFRLRQEDIEGRLLYEVGGRQWDSERLRERLAGVITQDIHFQGFEFTYTLPDGQEIVLLLNARRVVRQLRKEAILLAIENITQHRRAQRLSEEREAWFHAMVDNSPALTWVAGTDGRYTYLNRAWLVYTGRTMEEEVGQGWAQGIHPDDRVLYLATYHANFADRKPFSAEYRLMRHDGQYRWMLEHAQPTTSPEGTFNGYIGTCAEVHLQKELQQELDRRVEQRTQELETANTNLQAVLDSSPTWIAFFRAVIDYQPAQSIIDFHLAVCNQKFADLFGQSALAIKGQSVTQFPNLFYQTPPLERLRHIQETGEPFYQENPNPDDPDVWTAVSASRFDGGVVVTGLDITALKQAEQQQQHWLEEVRNSNESFHKLEELQQYLKQRGQFLRETSHDLRGNFGVISGAASLLAMVSSEEERSSILDMLKRNISQATEMLTQLLDYARLEAGQEHLRLTNFNVSNQIRQLCEKMQPLVAEKALWLRTDGPDQLLVESDAVKIERIIQNLVLNAIRYTQQGGILVQWHETGDQWSLRIEDTGPGLPPEVVQRLRQSLSTAQDPASLVEESGNSRIAVPGEGIGLSIVRQLCKLLSAHLEVQTEPGTGTVFQITWPRWYGSPAAGGADGFANIGH
ncbi:chemotaxis protein CheB [Larkinella sp. VNQ87]|uniref:chemotaxis protein CheB n=1 Tax=Larkinella sp. VNQ87 TaxID=3400921 RepID=UPI003BFF8993